MAGRRTDNRHAEVTDMETCTADFRIGVEPVDRTQARIVLEARIRFGRGMGHGGALNVGDCFSCALAKVLGAPLLYIGDDFAMTDVVSAL
ncbi:MAG: PIN domain nuclease [Alphaproteobacteria bacterium]|nr:PIN domain nuclease [Alphaproteobacteria bacterium]